MPEFMFAAMFGALIWKLVEFMTYVSASEWKPVTKQAIAWAVGVAVIFLAAETGWADTVSFEGVTLTTANAAEKVFLGLSATSLFASVPVSILKAVDSSDSSKVPQWGG